jgi:hypothetical protein
MKEMIMERPAAIVVVAVFAAGMTGFGCSGPTPNRAPDRATLASESGAALDAFRNEDPSLLSGNLSAVAIKAGAARSADTSKGVIVFVRSKGGLMAEASVGGQRFRYQPAGATTAKAS